VNEKKNTLLVILTGTVLSALAIILVWLLQPHPENNTQANDLTQRLPDFIIHDVNSQQFTVQGTLQYEMAAKKLIHYPTNDITELFQPMMDFKSDRQGHWAVRSKRGFVAGETDIIELTGAVYSFQANRANTQSSHAFTSTHYTIDRNSFYSSE
jgi:lipopolysaccharide export system protein LptC